MPRVPRVQGLIPVQENKTENQLATYRVPFGGLWQRTLDLRPVRPERERERTETKQNKTKFLEHRYTGLFLGLSDLPWRCLLEATARSFLPLCSPGSPHRTRYWASHGEGFSPEAPTANHFPHLSG